jgi:CheY-like chemotaxis protein
LASLPSAGRRSPEEIDLLEELEDLLHFLGPWAHMRSLDLALIVSPAAPARLVIEPAGLHQMLASLVGTAVQTSMRGEVVVEVGLATRAADLCIAPSARLMGGSQGSPTPAGRALRFLVRDNSAGLPVDRLHQLLDRSPSEQEPNSTDWESHIQQAKQLAHLQGGHLTLESIAGAGNRFTLTLPCTEPASSARPAPLVEPRLRERSVLLADDSPTLRRVFQEWLAGWGMRVTVAEGGQAALTALRQAHNSRRPFDLVLLDVRMPRPSGLAVAEQASRHGWAARTVLLLVSPPQRRDDNEVFRQLGIRALVVKPVRRRDLLNALLTGLAGPGTEPRPAQAVSTAVCNL